MATLLEKRVIELLRSGQGRTQAELCRLTGQNSSTVSEILGRLRRRKVVESVGDEGKGLRRGRPGTILRLTQDGCVGGIDIDGAHALIGILDFHANVLASKLIGFDARRLSPEQLLVQCDAVLRSLMSQRRMAWKHMRGVGIVVNGQISASGLLKFSTVLPWRDQPVAAIARKLLSMPVFVSDRHQAAVAEQRYGAGKNSRCMLYFNVADGVSARPVVDGQIYATSAGGKTGQIGHVVVIPNGPACGCGQRGCLEAIISGPAICRRIIEDAGTLPASCRPPSSLSGPALENAAIATINKLTQLAQSSNRYAEALCAQVVDLAARGLTMATACFAPDRIVVDGYVFRDRPALLERLIAAAAEKVGGPAAGGLSQVVSSQLGDQARLMALATLVSDGLARDGALAG
ncbi:MAG: ROK family transcriptional regulator [Phycisphaerales bacterium]|nr:ROK family transcriptional regulator [Phycisphaerales bacterium]